MNMPGDRRLIQVVPQLKPAGCGISDHAIALAGELRKAYGIDTAFAVLNSDEPCDVPYPVLHCAPDRLLHSCIALSEDRPAALLVHLSGYGYSADGAPTLLAEALQNLKADGRFRIAVFFHELFATGMPWKSAFWHSRRQERAVRSIAETCDLLVTSTRSYVDWLRRETVRQSASPIQCLPVFSQFGEPQQHIPLADRDPVMVAFGLGPTRQRAFKELSALGDMLRQLGVQEILDIGPEFEPPHELSGIPVRRMGVLAAAEIAQRFSRSTFGFLSYAPSRLAKSGVFAGYCAHGVIPVVAQHFSGEFDGLQDGVQVLSPRTAAAAQQASGLESCSIAAWRWYGGHSLHDHASTYARWLDQAPDTQESLTISTAGKDISAADKLPTVAICIGTYNQSQYLRGAIASALAQTYPIREIWVSDDASTDDTASVMREICAQHPQIRSFRQPVNLGLPGNITWLLSQPQTDLIVRLDSDDRLEPEYVAVLAGLMRQYPDAGYAHCDVTEIDGEGKPRRIRRLMRTSAYESAEQALRGNASGYRVAANCILYRAQAIKEVDYYRPTLSWRYCEDWDMIVRLAIAGWGNVYAPQNLSNYRVWDDGKGVRASRKMAEVRETAEIYKARLIPEYTKRGWTLRPLQRHMRSKAVLYAEAIDAPQFTREDREEYKRLLLNLSDSPRISLAIRMAEYGLNPLVRFSARTRIQLKDQAKRILRWIGS